MQRGIQLLASGANKRGDLLTDLVDPVISRYGYRVQAKNVYKTGREVDLMGAHRHEQRECVVECKSGTGKAGGSDINKFLGVLERERREKKRPVHGYFVCLAGFTGSALAQEQSEDLPLITLLDAADLRRELIECEVIATPQSATTIAIQAVGTHAGTLVDEPELFGHAVGWLWAVYFVNGDRRGVCFVHADGHPLNASATAQVLDSVEAMSTATRPPSLADCVPLPAADRPDDLDPVRRDYVAFLERELGGFALQGMAADSITAHRPKLEALYEPSAFVDVDDANAIAQHHGGGHTGTQHDPEPALFGLGEAITRHRHLVIVGLPGSGKTTIISRLAVGYADPTRRTAVGDDLPDVPVLPLLIACRQVQHLCGRPIPEVIAELAAMADMPASRQALLDLVVSELHQGRLLLLVDGLDEIHDVEQRSRFVESLTSFLAVYPHCRLVLTSREVGFRPVSHLLSATCHTVRVRDLTDKRIAAIVRNWYTQFVGDTVESSQQAKRLTETILDTNPIRELATNPLLLTILLLVQHGMNGMPRQRANLYRRAIEVLATSWNTQAYEPLNHDETVAQLAFAAYQMMKAGRSSVTLPELTTMISTARNELPRILGLITTPVAEFIDRVEERTGLLVQAGHTDIDGQPTATYEFKHLTFQAYLAAVAIAKGWVHTPDGDHSVEALLAGHFADEAWQEVVSLAAVRGGDARATSVVTALLAALHHTTEAAGAAGAADRADIIYANLVSCLRDEVLIGPDLAAQTIQAALRYSSIRPTMATKRLPLGKIAHGGRFAALTHTILLEAYSTGHDNPQHLADQLAHLAALDCITQCARPSQYGAWIASKLSSADERDQLHGAGAAMYIAYLATEDRFDERPDLTEPAMILFSTLDETAPEDRLLLLRLWAIAWLIQYTPLENTTELNALQITLARLSMRLRHPDHARLASWALMCTAPTGNWTMSTTERRALLRFAQQHTRDQNAATQDDLQRARTYAGFLIRFFLAPSRRSPSLIADIQAYCASGAPVKACIAPILTRLGSRGHAALAALNDLTDDAR